MASYNEASEVHAEDSLHDLNMFSSITKEIQTIMQQISHLKSKTPDKGKEEINELRLTGSLHFMTLKKLNRLAQIRCKNAKDSTLEAKQKLDANNLRLQNLQYEISHLDREVNNCLQFKSKHEDIDLVSVNEFYTEAPPTISKENETRTDNHLQTLARLDWELENRKTLKEELTQAHEKKDKICEGIKKRKQDLDSLKPNLETILKSTMPLQEALGDHFTETRALYDTAYLLPQPLYVLFVQAKAFSDACDRNMDVQIGGDVNVAKRLKDLETRKVVDATNLYKNRYEDDSDSENEDDQENKRGRRKSTSTKAASSEVMNIDSSISKHPLFVSLKIYLESKTANSSYLLMRFYSYDSEFVTVIPSLELCSSLNEIKKSRVIAASSLLNDLQLVDNGTSIPHKATGTGKHSTGISFSENEFGYVWAQKLAGLVALQDGEVISRQSGFSTMHLIIKLIRKRIESRLSLANQLNDYSNNVVTCDPSFRENFAPVVLFKLSSWKCIDFHDYSQMEFTSAARELDLVSKNDYFYCGTLQRGSSANVEVAVAVSDKYPTKWPLFRIQVCWHGNHTAENNLNVREIEVEVNCKMPQIVMKSRKKLQNELLSVQLYRLLTLLDIYVETDCNMDGSDMPSEFPTSKLCPRMSKGRARLKPFKYNARHKFQCY
ncbi:THO complex subunit 5 homolog [Styela clava]